MFAPRSLYPFKLLLILSLSCVSTIFHDEVLKEFHISRFNNFIRLQIQKSICFNVKCISYKITFDPSRTQPIPFSVLVLIISYTPSHFKITDIWRFAFSYLIWRNIGFSSKEFYSLYEIKTLKLLFNRFPFSSLKF